MRHPVDNSSRIWEKKIVTSNTAVTRRSVRMGTPASIAAVITFVLLMVGLWFASPARAEFGIAGFDGQVSANPEGDPFSQAGGHPYAASTTFRFNTITDPVFGQAWPEEPAKNVAVDLPPGFIGNPSGIPECTLGELLPGGAPICPVASQVGSVVVEVSSTLPPGSEPPLTFAIGPLAVYNMVPPPDAPARFGFNIVDVPVMLDAEVRSDGDYGITINTKNLSEGTVIVGTELTLWGVPPDASHDPQRWCPGSNSPGCSSQAPHKPFLRNPTACTPDGVGLTTTLRTDSWFDPGDVKVASFVSHAPPGFTLANPLPADSWGPPLGPTGCELVPFKPTLKGTPASINSPGRVGKPSGFSFDLELPQTDLPDLIATSDLKKAVVTLPEGVRVSPSAADGLSACAPSQIALGSRAAPTCPDASKVGTLQIETPVLDEPLTGAVYLGTPRENPFETLLSLYLVAEGPGVILKLAGKVETDPVTGQITTTFDNQPQLPFERLHLELRDGPRAAVVLPTKCGVYTTRAVMTSWSGKTVTTTSDFTLSQDGQGAPCPPPSFTPGFEAGTADPIAGATTAFLMLLSRDDEDEELRSLSIDMPQGLSAYIKNVPLCPESHAAAGTCGEGSRVGSVTVDAGAGPNPFFIDGGRAYLAGPYKGAPFSLSIVVPAVAGPFDLGTVVVRAALHVNRRTAAIHVESDPLPTILEGIPLQVRVVHVNIDRPRFFLNPSSCKQKQIRAVIGSTEGNVAHLSSRFRVGNCDRLALKPKLRLRVGAKGRTRKRTSTPLTATLTQTPGQTNLKSVAVALPTTLNALLPVVNRACTLAEFNTSQCEKARAGTAVAITPLLADPLTGGAYFVKNPNRPLPDLMVALRGQVAFDLVGRITIPGGKRLSTTFDAIPDVPLSKFTLKLVAGKNGPIGIANNLCTRKSKRAIARIDYTAQNGKTQHARQRLTITGCNNKNKQRR